MSRRARATAFLVFALSAAGLAAAIADGYSSRVAGRYGALQTVVVVSSSLRADQPIGPEQVAAALERRRVPERFVPAGALSHPAAALGLAPRTTLPPGSYLLASQLQAPRSGDRTPPALRGGRRPVEISVSGADALLTTGAGGGSRQIVDVVVTDEPGGEGGGHTYVAAVAVPLIGLGPGPDGPGPGGLSAAILGLTRRQALRLIAAESFARKVTLLPGG